MSLLLRPDDPRLTWQGAVSLERTDQWVMPWRIPFEDRGLYPPDALRERAAFPSGVRIAFVSDTTEVAGRVEPDADEGALDLFCNGEMLGSEPLAGRDEFRFDGLPPREKVVELWLPLFARFRLRSLELSPGASLAPHDDARPRWTAYGSSITHGRGAERPSEAWPSIVAREAGLNLTSLGYAGNCHLEPMIARLVRDLPADFISMKVGINIYGSGSLNARTFRPAIIGFVQIVREKHPDTPLAVISPIYSAQREAAPSSAGLSLRDMREEVAAAVEALRAHGDRDVHYVEGLKLLGPEHAHFIPDEVHPNAEGYQVLGRNFLRYVATPVFAHSTAVQSS